MGVRGRHWTYAQEKSLLPAILRRDGYVCQVRLPGCTVRATAVDHIYPRAWGGRAVPENLRAACSNCNNGRNNPDRRFFKGDGSRRAPLRNLSPHSAHRPTSLTIGKAPE